MHSKWKMFGQLYRKDMHQVLPELLLVIILSVAMNLAILLGSGIMTQLLIGPTFMLFGLAVLLPLISSFKTFRQEWNNKTVYLLMSLPVSGGMIMGSRLLALVTQFVTGTIVVGVGALLATYHIIPKELIDMSALHSLLSNAAAYKYLAVVSLSGLAYMLFLFCNSLFSQIVGRISRKLSGWITLGAFIAVIWGSQKVLELIGIGQFSGTLSENNAEVIFQNIVMPAFTSYTIGYLIFALLLFVGSVIIYDRRLEV
ncbi:MAG TPA: hypothetical protein DER33_03320 [Syntrophomonas sp.]|jgi:hypothetical protein|nr:hypothetical protein [Syntrophomonas sp.]